MTTWNEPKRDFRNWTTTAQQRRVFPSATHWAREAQTSVATAFRFTRASLSRNIRLSDMHVECLVMVFRRKAHCGADWLVSKVDRLTSRIYVPAKGCSSDRLSCPRVGAVTAVKRARSPKTRFMTRSFYRPWVKTDPGNYRSRRFRFTESAGIVNCDSITLAHDMGSNVSGQGRRLDP